MRTQPVRPADGVLGWFYESFVPWEDYRGLGLRGRTLSRPLSASVCGKYDMPSRRPYERIAEGLISACRKHVVVATRLSPFKVGDNQRLERTMSGAAKTSAYFPLHDQPPTGTKESELSPLSRTLYEVGGLIFRHPPSGATRIVDTKAEGFPPRLENRLKEYPDS